MNKTRLLSGLAAICLATISMAPSHAGTLKNGAPANLTIGGQVSRAMLYVNDGDAADFRSVDNDAENTGFKFEAEVQLTPTISMGAIFDGDVVSNSSSGVSMTSDSDSGGTFAEDTLDLFFTHKTLGTLYLGQGDAASDAISEVDLSGTALGGYSSIADMAGGFAFVNSNGTRSTTTIGTVANNLDGLDAGDRIRWDSPELAGFHLRVGTLSAGGTTDAAVGYAGEFGGTAIEGSVGVYTGGANQGVSGSVSALMANGLNITLAAGSQELENGTRSDSPFFWYGKIGYQAKLTALGKTNIAIDFGQFNDVAVDGDEFQTIGVQLVQDIDKAGANLFLAYRHHSLDRTGSSFDDISAVMGGAFLAF